MKIWSEVPGARLREQLADVATLVWVVFWGRAVWLLYSFLSGFASAGRTIGEGGTNLTEAGQDLGASLEGLPLVGPSAAGLVRDAFAGAGQPLVDFGAQVEAFIVAVAAVLALLLALIALIPWLSRYIPWRWGRMRRVRAAHLALRRRSDLSEPQVDQILAMRAITNLDYPTLLEFTPDPLGDWAAGRHDRLARAELASVGLAPR